MPLAVGELGRVTESGGRLCFSVTHPISDAGTFQSREADAPFIIQEGYLGTRRFEDTGVERDGLKMVFAGWAHSFESYVLALEEAGFLVERVREPRVPERYLEKDPAEGRWLRIPNFLHVRAVKS